MTITILKCNQCWSFTDDFLVNEGIYQKCSCGSVYVREVNPTLLVVVSYVMQNFKHFMKLFMQDIREKCSWKRM